MLRGLFFIFISVYPPTLPPPPLLSHNKKNNTNKKPALEPRPKTHETRQNPIHKNTKQKINKKGGYRGPLPHSHGSVSSWPSLLHLPGITAAETIQKSSPSIKIVTIVRPGEGVTKDMRFDRVRVFVDEEGRVWKVPRVG